MLNITRSSAGADNSSLTSPNIWKESIMSSSREILRSVAVIVAGLVAMLIAIVVLGLCVGRSISKEPSVFPVAIPWKDKPLRSVLPLACRVGS
jgi:hypothetical protein